VVRQFEADWTAILAIDVTEALADPRAGSPTAAARRLG
jgi:hypothetical protein